MYLHKYCFNIFVINDDRVILFQVLVKQMGSDPDLHLHSHLEVDLSTGNDTISCSAVEDFILMGYDTEQEKTEEEQSCTRQPLDCLKVHSPFQLSDISPPPYSESVLAEAEPEATQKLPATVSPVCYRTRARVYSNGIRVCSWIAQHLLFHLSKLYKSTVCI